MTRHRFIPLLPLLWDLVLSLPVLTFTLCSVCKAARADLVFLVDGSWSIGDDNFVKIIRFLYSTAGALDQIGPDGTQVPSQCEEQLFKVRKISDVSVVLSESTLRSGVG